MAHCLAGIPGPVDGGLVVAQPLRAGRWLLRRPQALAPLALVAPPGETVLSELEAAARAMARNARGPMAAWWRDGQLAVSASLSAGARQAVTEIAEIRGLPWQDMGEHLAVATHSGLLGGTRMERPALPAERSAALVLARDRTWSVTLGRSRLEAVSGFGAEFPPPDFRASRLATRDAGALLDLFGLPAPPGEYPLFLAFGRESGWGLMMPDEHLRPRVARILGSPGRGRERHDSAITSWQGLLGQVWHVRDGDWVVIGSKQELVAVLRDCNVQGEWGHIAGEDLAYLIERVAAVSRTIGVGSRARRALDSVAEGSRQVRHASWQLNPDGGALTIEW